MTSTNKTDGFQLSQFLPDDRPTVLGDYNADMARIDQTLTMQTANINTALATANNAARDVSGAVTTTTSFDNRIINLEQTVPNITTNLASEYKAADAVVAKDSNDRDTALSDRITTNLNKFANYYTKTESDGLYQRNVDSRARVVVIGDQNSVPLNSWVDSVATQRDWVVYNYATAGAGYSTGGDNTYSSQLSKAVADSRFTNDNISMVIIASSYNDVVSKYNVSSMAEAMFGQTSRAFVNARVVVIPLFWRPFAVSGYDYTLQFSKLRRIEELRSASKSASVDYVPYSYTWFETNDVDSSGNYLPAYYEHIANWVNRFMDGGNTANDITIPLTSALSNWDISDTADRFGPHIARRGDICHVLGSVKRTASPYPTRGDVLLNIPTNVQPAMVNDIVATKSALGGAVSMIAGASGILFGQTLASGDQADQINFDGYYRIG